MASCLRRPLGGGPWDPGLLWYILASKTSWEIECHFLPLRALPIEHFGLISSLLGSGGGGDPSGRPREVPSTCAAPVKKQVTGLGEKFTASGAVSFSCLIYLIFG